MNNTSTPDLSGHDKKILRGKAQLIEPKLHIGKNGLSDSLVNDFLFIAKKDELIKIRFHLSDRKEIITLCEKIETTLNSPCIAQVGKTACFFTNHLNTEI